MPSDSLVVAEKFISIQGEGRTRGVPSAFIRVAGCNLLCSSKNWVCDTIPVWKKGKKEKINDIVNWILKHNIKNIIITGGEPALQELKIKVLIKKLLEKNNFSFEIETNGTIPFRNLLEYKNKILFNISPKLSNAGEKAFFVLDSLLFLTKEYNFILKFVVKEENDLKEVDALVKKLNVDSKKIYIMPAADNRESLINVSKKIIPYVIQYDYNFTGRDHIFIWDKKTGV